ncbi:senescence-specific cysteine protease SAG39-like protein [Tanacetum coccineum]
MLVLLLAFVMCACQVTSRVLNEEVMQQKYQQWIVRYGRAYRDSKELVMQFKIFKENVAYIEDFNSEHLAYKLSINKFADQNKEEFIATHTLFRVPSTLRLAQNMKFRYDSVTGIPSSMDWRQKGAVTVGDFSLVTVLTVTNSLQKVIEGL